MNEKLQSYNTREKDATKEELQKRHFQVFGYSTCRKTMKKVKIIMTLQILIGKMTVLVF